MGQEKGAGTAWCWKGGAEAWAKVVRSRQQSFTDGLLEGDTEGHKRCEAVEGCPDDRLLDLSRLMKGNLSCLEGGSKGGREGACSDQRVPNSGSACAWCFLLSTLSSTDCLGRLAERRGKREGPANFGQPIGEVTTHGVWVVPHLRTGKHTARERRCGGSLQMTLAFRLKGVSRTIYSVLVSIPCARPLENLVIWISFSFCLEKKEAPPHSCIGRTRALEAGLSQLLILGEGGIACLAAEARRRMLREIRGQNEHVSSKGGLAALCNLSQGTGGSTIQLVGLAVIRA